jgi:hypothetical protein
MECASAPHPDPLPRVSCSRRGRRTRGEGELTVSGRFARGTYPRRFGPTYRALIPLHKGVALMRRHRREGGVQCRAGLNAESGNGAQRRHRGVTPGPRARLKATNRPQTLRGAANGAACKNKWMRCPPPRSPLSPKPRAEWPLRGKRRWRRGSDPSAVGRCFIADAMARGLTPDFARRHARRAKRQRAIQRQTPASRPGLVSRFR